MDSKDVDLQVPAALRFLDVRARVGEVAVEAGDAVGRVVLPNVRPPALGLDLTCQAFVWDHLMDQFHDRRLFNGCWLTVSTFWQAGQPKSISDGDFGDGAHAFVKRRATVERRVDDTQRPSLTVWLALASVTSTAQDLPSSSCPRRRRRRIASAPCSRSGEGGGHSRPSRGRRRAPRPRPVWSTERRLAKVVSRANRTWTCVCTGEGNRGQECASAWEWEGGTTRRRVRRRAWEREHEQGRGWARG